MDRFFTAYCMLCIAVLTVEAGTCFRKRGRDQKCKRLMRVGINRTQCCELRGSFFTEEDVTDWFTLSVRNGGADNCTPACGNSCSQVYCPRNQVCDTFQGEPYCRCQVECDARMRVRRRFCATDNHTYYTLCEMERAKCARNDVFTKLRYYGSCDDASSCYEGRCPRSRVCVQMASGYAACQIRLFFPCVRPSAPPLPYCGHNGVSYSTYCDLQKASQRLGYEIRSVGRGNCPGTSAEKMETFSNLRWLAAK